MGGEGPKPESLHPQPQTPNPNLMGGALGGGMGVGFWLWGLKGLHWISAAAMELQPRLVSVDHLSHQCGCLTCEEGAPKDDLPLS